MINFDELFKNHQATRTDCGSLSIITYKNPNHSKTGFVIFLTTNSQP